MYIFGIRTFFVSSIYGHSIVSLNRVAGRRAIRWESRLESMQELWGSVRKRRKNGLLQLGGNFIYCRIWREFAVICRNFTIKNFYLFSFSTTFNETSFSWGMCGGDGGRCIWCLLMEKCWVNRQIKTFKFCWFPTVSKSKRMTQFMLMPKAFHPTISKRKGSEISF